MVKIKGKRLKMGKNQAALLAKCFAKKMHLAENVGGGVFR